MDRTRTMNPTLIETERGEEGSALIIAVLVTVILALLGLSYLMMAQTESTIAENERNAATALYVAEAGARLAVNWFNDPSSTGYLVPTTGQIDRTQRVLDHDNNTGTARVQAVAADATKPLYKDAAVTSSLVFDRPYRTALGETFLGVETGTDAGFPTAGPDVVVSSAHLTTINTALFPNFPTAGLRARISRIEFYAPPIVSIGGAATRMGIATVKVTAGVFIYPGTADERQVATRVVKAVVNEIPIPGPGGPLQSCANLAYTGNFQIHWGAGSAIGTADLGLNAGNLTNKAPTGMPYAVNDPGTYAAGADSLATWAANHNNENIDDPWFKFIAGGNLQNISFAPFPSDPQPWHSASPGSTTTDSSNLFQNTVINCPTFDYGLWKSIAQSGNKNHFYFSYDTATTNFKLDGVGAAMTMEAATGSRSGVFFFDTYDGTPPFGLYTDTWPTTNLTPAISMSVGWPGTQGFVYLNSKQFASTGSGASGTARTIIPPGEPGDGSGWVNINYPGSFTGNYRISTAMSDESFQDPVTGDWWCTDISPCPGGLHAAIKDNYGLPFQETVVMDGVFYNSGTFSAQGNARYFGSLIAQQGVLDGGGTPELYFDESLVKGNWPRKGMNLPRVVISAWQTDL
jgi:Tfp pilus assembly protein PilX